VIGGRMLATALATGILNATQSRDGSGTYMDMAELKADARAQGKAFAAANTTAIADRFSQYTADTSAADKAKVALYTSRLTYGLPNTNPTGAAAAVPKGAEILLETRLPYMGAAERREVLRTTAIDSGFALTDDDEGYGRLNLMKAAGGYGRFDSNVTVSMNAANGGFDARDVWKNDISGTGGLTKKGTGELALTGNNTFTGDVQLDGGTLVGQSANAFGAGDIYNNAGTLVINHRGTLTVAGDYTQAAGSVLEAYISNDASYDIFSVLGLVSLDGDLSIVFQNGFNKLGSFSLIAANNILGKFNNFRFSGLSNAYTASISYSSGGVSLNVTAVPEPQSYAMFLLGLGLLGFTLRKKSA
jgi:autotransporter-associated beta strand protein